ncbi:butyrophilin subfamily 1 member A1-like, partial [Clarias magur]
SLTLDPSTAPKCLKVSRDGKSVSCEKPNSKSECKFPHVVSKEELGSGQHYWEWTLNPPCFLYSVYWDENQGVKRTKRTAMLLIYIASLLVCSAAEFSLVIPKSSVSAQLGSSVVLPCSLSPPLNARTFEVQWYTNKNSKKTVLLLYQDLSVQEIMEDARYRDRVSLIGELEKGDVSLELKNLTAADEGEYVCRVQSISWYEKGSVNLVVKALGSPVLISLADAGILTSQVLMVNVTCTSGGWSPKPTLTWRDSAGRELPNSQTHYRTDSEGLVSVSSWLLVSPSQSDWISCTVGLNHQEVRESRIVPLRPQSQDSEGFWKEAFVSTLVLSLTIIIICTILLILSRKGLLRHSLFHKNAKTAVNSHESLQPETLPLNTKENTKQVNSHESLKTETVPVNTTENITQESTDEKRAWRNRHKVSLTLDPSTAPRCLKVSRDGKSVSCEKPNSKSKCKFPHVVSKEELGSGQHYWEVMVWDKTS